MSLEILSRTPDKDTTLLKITAITLQSFSLAIAGRHLTRVFNILPKMLSSEEQTFWCVCDTDLVSHSGELSGRVWVTALAEVRPRIPGHSSGLAFMALTLSSFQHTPVVLLI